MRGDCWARCGVVLVVVGLVASACGGGSGGGEEVQVPAGDGGGDARGVLLSSSGLDLGRLAEAVETLDPAAVCAEPVSPVSFDDVVEVGRIEGGCALIEYVALEGRTVDEVLEELSLDPSVFAVGLPAVDLVPAAAAQAQGPFDGDGYRPGDWWHWQAIGADVLWDPAGWAYVDEEGNNRQIEGWPAGSVVVVAVIDSGADGTHRDLDANVLASGDECHRTPTGSHGTHVAGLVAAERNNGVDVAGLAPRAKILSIKVHFGDDFDYWAKKTNPADPACYRDVPTLTRAIDRARVSGADVINLSLSWPRERNYAVVQEREGILSAAGQFIVGADTVEWAV